MVFSAILLLGAPRPVHADTSSWFKGNYDVLLGYGCTTASIELWRRRRRALHV